MVGYEKDAEGKEMSWVLWVATFICVSPLLILAAGYIWDWWDRKKEKDDAKKV